MQAILPYLLLIIGFVFLVKGADWFVDGSSSAARLLKVPSIVIGLTIVAFGTSAPELAVSLTAALNGSNGIAVGNVVGSNFFNLLMIIGICALIKPMHINKNILKSEFPISIVCGILLLVMLADATVFYKSENILSHLDGIILLVLFALFVVAQIRNALHGRKQAISDAAIPESEVQVVETEADEIKVLSPVKSVVLIIVGLVLVIFGGDLVVDNATIIAQSFGLSDAFIGLTIVAFGTSLPELFTSIVAARKGENDLALGNVVGSNIFNILLILGVSSAIHPITVGVDSLIDLAILTVMSIITYIMAWHKCKLNRVEGCIMIAMYLGYVGYLVSQI